MAWPLCGAAQTDTPHNSAPLSAMDWLDQIEVQEPTATPLAPPREDPVVTTALPPAITATSLSDFEGRAIGLLSPAITGLPEDLWTKGAPDGQTIVDALINLPVRLVPATQDLRMRLLLAQSVAPIGIEAERFAQIRAFELARIGRVAEAQALLAQFPALGSDSFADFAAYGLLMDDEEAVCARLSALTPDQVAKDLQGFCLARGGDWSAAALIVQTAGALGDISPEMTRLMGQFLEPELADEAMPEGPLGDLSPLGFRLREAIGVPLTTTDLPLPYAVTALRPHLGWKAQLEAAERLAAVGAVSANQLLGLYTDRVPAASGEVWDRVAAVQRLDAAIGSENEAIALRQAYDVMARAGLLHNLAQMFGERISDASPDAARLKYLSRAYETVQTDLEDPDLSRLARGIARGIARGDTAPLSEPDEALLAALHQGFAQPPAGFSNPSLGGALLTAMTQIGAAMEGDTSGVAAALITLRAAGLEDIARRTALGLLLLPEASR